MVTMGLVLVLAATPIPPVEPAPSWAVQRDVPPLPAKTSGGTHLQLRDTQVRIDETIEVYERRVWKVLTQPGVEALANQQFEWNPASETLALHGVWVWRDGKRRDAWHLEDARVLQLEEDLSAGIYDGRLKLVLELRDVRPGDVVECAYTRRGENPVFRKHLSFWAAQAGNEAISSLHFELHWKRPGTLKPHLRGGAVAPEVKEKNGAQVFSWSLRDVEPVAWEARTPRDVEQWPVVLFSDWGEWADVRGWGEQLFDQSAKGEEFEALVTKLRALPENARAREAVRIVQDDVRYVGVELGEHSHLPHTPDWVLTRGFGDCKDKTLLLTSLLRAVGIAAWPALVNTDAAAGFVDHPPTPHAFNHAIVRVDLESGPVFIDATSTLNRGPLENREPLSYQYALVMKPDVTELEPIDHPMPLAPTWDITQKWATRDDGSASLTVITVARGHEAAPLRRSIERDTRAALQKVWRKQRVAALETELTSTAIEWSDDPEAETFTLTEQYEVPNFYKDDAHEFVTFAIEDDLTWPPEGERVRPLAVLHPLHVHERIEWETTAPLKATAFEPGQSTHGRAFLLETSTNVSDGKLVLEWTLRNRADRIQPTAFAAHRKATQAAFETTSYTVKAGSKPAPGVMVATTGHELFNLVGIGFLVVVAMGIVTWFTAANERWDRLKARVRIDRFSAMHKGSDGELASQPALLDSLQAGAKLFTTPVCPRNHLWPPPVESGTVRLGDERVTVLTRRCPVCDAREDRYVKLRN